MILSHIAALSENRVIGLKQKLPWHIPQDLQRFKALTRGHPVIMGRKTFESVGRPLPERRNVVITRQTGFAYPDIEVVRSVDDAISLFTNNEQEVFIVGGEEIYNQTLHLADRLYLTIVHKICEGDAFYPEVDLTQFRLEFEEHHQAPLAFTYRNYVRT